MSSTYALVENGTVVNVIEWDGTPYTAPVEATHDEDGNELTPAIPAKGFQIPDGVSVVALDPSATASIGWAYADGKFTAPAAQTPTRTPADILAFNTGRRDNALSAATMAIAPLQDAVDLGDATDAEIALLKAWKTYRVAVNRVDLTQASPTWPTAPTT